MARLSVVCVAAVLIACCLLDASEAASFQDCPPSSQHTRCENKCTRDDQCSHTGGKCCPNLCNFSSCVIPKAANSGNAGYKGSSAGGAYCNNVKCSPFEKCGLDRTTNRMKCIRA